MLSDPNPHSAPGDDTVHVCDLSGPYINQDFLDTLASLSQVDLTFEQALTIFRSRLKNGIRTYIALVNDRVVGTLTLLIERKFLHSGGLVGHIEDVAVHRDFQRQGIGAAMVHHATEQARTLGCYKVILNCFPDRVAFYEKLGYRKHDVGMRINLSQDGEPVQHVKRAGPRSH